MWLLATELQREDINFIDARGVHSSKGLRIEKVVVVSEVDAEKVRAWAAREAHRVSLAEGALRVATEDEIRKHDEIPW